VKLAQDEERLILHEVVERRLVYRRQRRVVAVHRSKNANFGVFQRIFEATHG